MEVAETVKTVTNEFSRIFRHLVPGAVICGIALVAYPTYWQKFDIQSGSHWMALGALSIIAGNVWYVFHRFTIHNLIDYVYYRCAKGMWTGYLQWLSQHIRDSFNLPMNQRELRNFIHFRSSQVILLLMIAEALFVFSFFHEDESILFCYELTIRIISAVVFFISLIQFWIGFNLDCDMVEELTNRSNKQASGGSGD